MIWRSWCCVTLSSHFLCHSPLQKIPSTVQGAYLDRNWIWGILIKHRPSQICLKSSAKLLTPPVSLAENTRAHGPTVYIVQFSLLGIFLSAVIYSLWMVIKIARIVCSVDIWSFVWVVKIEELIWQLFWRERAVTLAWYRKIETKLFQFGIKRNGSCKILRASVIKSNHWSHENSNGWTLKTTDWWKWKWTSKYIANEKTLRLSAVPFEIV